MKEGQREVKSVWSIAGIITIILAVLNPFVIMLVSNTGFTVKQIDSLGTIGDFFGGTTVGLLSLASIFFVIHTIAIQREELKLTREEFETGNTTAKVQQIDNAFFNMLSLHHQIVNNIKIDDYYDKKTFTGREAIAMLTNICKQNIAKYNYFLKQNSLRYSHWQHVDEFDEIYLNQLFACDAILKQEDLDEVYKDFHDEYGNDIGHYMRNNYRIVKFIVNNVVDDEYEQKKVKEKTGREPIIGDRRYYFGMLRAQWSNAEFELILINSLYEKNHKFKNLILKYDVLDIEDKENNTNPEMFKFKESMDKFKAYRSLIEVIKSTC
ncbi:putative phage abortive infection protein [Bacillus cereus]|uniref:putative phage abortive infection protein n=1 Tax=Bacillus cereus TaxID=1396 RepID=UPI000BFB6D91|nr:putative phage abortive infection protein [Bacillus cereus]PGV79314.1 hypothetical protein COD84_08665 [Bacillus cereus]